MLACVAALRERLAGTTDPDRRAALVSAARRQVERLRKAFKRRIDARAVSQYGFSVNAREGIERRLSEVTAEALAAVDEAGSAGAEPGTAPDGAAKPAPAAELGRSALAVVGRGEVGGDEKPVRRWGRGSWASGKGELAMRGRGCSR